jgi:hypothetical protein
MLIRFGILIVLTGVVAAPAGAQQPFRVYDPFYRNETARRTFDDDLALSGEVSYTATRGTTDPATQPDPLEVGLRLDYRLAPHLEVGVVVDVSGVGSGRALRWSWIVGRYGWTVGTYDYAFRLALDPDSDGRVGFPQADFAFVASSPIGPVASSDFAVGVRRVRRGFRQELSEASPPADAQTFVNGRALGWELHLMVAYTAFLSPSGSRVFASLSVERGDYDLVGVTDPGGEPVPTRGFRSGLVWLRPGVEFARPNFRFAPFLGLPVAQWAPEGENIPRLWPQIGVEVTLR